MRTLFFVGCIFLLRLSDAQIAIAPDAFPNAKKVVVRGKVMDTTKEYLPFAHIIFTNQKIEKKITLVTGSEGDFSTELVPGLYTIEVSFIGFMKYSQDYSLLKDTVLFDIVLQEKSEQLNEVVILANMEKDIQHNATGLIFNIKNDSFYKNLSASQVLSYLPGVQVSENGNISLEGHQVTVMLNGRFQKLSAGLLIMLLESTQGDQIKSIELVNTPSAKHNGKTQKVIDINLKKQRKNGLLGAFSVGVANANFAISPSVNLNYKTRKLIFSAYSVPYSRFRRDRIFFINRQLLDNSLSFQEEQRNVEWSGRNNHQLGIDYTINRHHLIWANVSVRNNNRETKVDFITDQFAFEDLTNTRLNTNMSNSRNSFCNVNMGYRFDMDKIGSRLDFTSNYGEGSLDVYNLNTNELVEISDDLVVKNRNRNNQIQRNKQFSTRLDYVMPIKSKLENFEVGLKYDDLSIADLNIFEIFNTKNNDYGVDAGLSNSFQYHEQVYSGYISVNSNYKKLKYSLGLRLEHIETKSFSITTSQTFKNAFTNFLPTIALKYMTNEKQTSNVNVSYRKGYNLPPYVQLNPFEIFVNSNTIKRGNPELTQSIYHLFRLGYTIKNKYFFSLNANFYANLFQTTQILENDITVVSYQNLGARSLYRLNFSTRFTLSPWWRINVSTSVGYSALQSEWVTNEVVTFSVALNNTFTLPSNFILRLSPSFSNGESSGPDTPNKFIRVNSNASLSKQFFKNKASLSIRISDIFGVGNKNESTYIIDNTRFSSRVVMQRPGIRLTLSYRFSSGKKINKKDKKKSGVNDSRF